MIETFKPISQFLQIKRSLIYDNAFLLQSRVTVFLLLACTVLISAKQYFGEPIQCFIDNPSNVLDFLNSFCWSMGTYIVEGDNLEWSGDQIGERREALMPGIGSHTVDGINKEKTYLRYYQWIVLILLLQAIAFYIPSKVWKVFENGRMRILCADICDPVITDDGFFVKKRELLCKYFSSDFKRDHKAYAFMYVLCSSLNMLICLTIIYTMQVVFNGFWMKYAEALGAVALNNFEIWNSKSSHVFPKMAKCDFYKFGYSGSIEKRDALCLLPLNILNEKIFCVLFIWYLLITAVSCLNVIYYLTAAISPKVRAFYFKVSNPLMSMNRIYLLLHGRNFGDWLLLSKMASKINSKLFDDFVDNLLNDMRKSKKNGTTGIAGSSLI